MDKMTPASAVELLRKHMSISWENREAIAALIEGMEAQAAAMQAGVEIWVDCNKEYSDRCSNNCKYIGLCATISASTSGADLLAVAKAAAEYRQAQSVCVGSDDSQHFINRSRAGKALDAALAAWGGGR